MTAVNPAGSSRAVESESVAAFGMPRIEGGLLPRIGITPHVAPPAIERRNQWQRHYRRLLVLADLAVVLFAAGAAAGSRSRR